MKPPARRPGSGPEDKAVYTNYQKALSNRDSNFADGQDKTATLRYAHGQDTAGIDPTVRHLQI